MHLFFRFFRLEQLANFGWDQVDNAWAAVNIIINHQYPIQGMVAKLNSGIFIGPLYYYLVSFVYLLTDLNPIASPILAGLTAILSFWIIYVVGKNVFGITTAIIAVSLYTCSSFVILTERIQWPVNFIAPVSLLIWYYLNKLCQGEYKYLPYLSVAVALSFHIHFTAVFFPVILLFTLPFFPRRREMIRYGIISFLLFTVLSSFQILSFIKSDRSGTAVHYIDYFRTYYHGFHLRRMLQITSDAFIKFQQILEIPYNFIRPAAPFIVPLFSLFYMYDKGKRSLQIIYTTLLWFIIPWMLFSTYKGEISDYYFNLGLYIAIIVLAYLVKRIWEGKNIIVRAFVIVFWVGYVYSNIVIFFNAPASNFLTIKAEAEHAVRISAPIPFTIGDPRSYWYYYYSRRNKNYLPYQTK